MWAKKNYETRDTAFQVCLLLHDGREFATAEYETQAAAQAIETAIRAALRMAA
jgi:hypothetical protein